MAVVEEAERRRRGRRCDRRSRRACRAAGRPRSAATSLRSPSDDEQAAAALDEPLQRAAAAGRRQRRVVQDDDRRACRSVAGVTRAAGTTSDLERGRRADASALREIEARVGAVAAVDDEHRHRLRSASSTKWNVLSAGSGSVPARTDAAHARLGQRERRERRPTPTRCARDGRRLASRSRGRRSRASPARPSPASSPLLVTPAVTVMRSWPENDARAKVDRRHGEVRACSATRPTPASASCPRRSARPRRRSSRSSGSR